MVKLGRSILYYIIQKYSIYNGIIEEYLAKIDELFVELSEKTDLVLQAKGIENFITEINRNNQSIAAYKLKRDELRSKKINFEKFKQCYEFKSIGECYDFTRKSRGFTSENEMQKILELNTNQNVENLFFKYLETLGELGLHTETREVSYNQNYLAPDNNIYSNNNQTHKQAPSTSQFESRMVESHSNTQFPLQSKNISSLPPLSQVIDLEKIMQFDSQVDKTASNIGNYRFQSKVLGSTLEKKNKQHKTGNAPEIVLNATVGYS